MNLSGVGCYRLSSLPATLRQRLLDRWKDLPEAEALAKTDGNDLPNAAFVRANSIAADIIL